MSKPRYVLVVEVTPQPDDPHGHRRLRLALKRMLRSLGLRCITIAPATTNATPQGGGVKSKRELTETVAPGA